MSPSLFLVIFFFSGFTLESGVLFLATHRCVHFAGAFAFKLPAVSSWSLYFCNMCLRTDTVKSSSAQDVSWIFVSPNAVGAGLMLLGFSNLRNKSYSNCRDDLETSPVSHTKTTGRGKDSTRKDPVSETTTLNGYTRRPSLLQASVLLALLFLALLVLAYFLIIYSYEELSWPRPAQDGWLARLYLKFLMRRRNIAALSLGAKRVSLRTG